MVLCEDGTHVARYGSPRDAATHILGFVIGLSGVGTQVLLICPRCAARWRARTDVNVEVVAAD